MKQVMRNMYDDQESHDVTFLFKDRKEVFTCHKTVLVHSNANKWFNVLFDLDEEQNEFTLADIEPLNFMLYVKHLYGFDIKRTLLLAYTKLTGYTYTSLVNMIEMLERFRVPRSFMTLIFQTLLVPPKRDSPNIELYKLIMHVKRLFRGCDMQNQDHVVAKQQVIGCMNQRLKINWHDCRDLIPSLLEEDGMLASSRDVLDVLSVMKFWSVENMFETFITYTRYVPNDRPDLINDYWSFLLERNQLRPDQMKTPMNYMRFNTFMLLLCDLGFTEPMDVVKYNAAQEEYNGKRIELPQTLSPLTWSDATDDSSEAEMTIAYNAARNELQVVGQDEIDQFF